MNSLSIFNSNWRLLYSINTCLMSNDSLSCSICYSISIRFCAAAEWMQMCAKAILRQISFTFRHEINSRGAFRFISIFILIQHTHLGHRCHLSVSGADVNVLNWNGIQLMILHAISAECDCGEKYLFIQTIVELYCSPRTPIPTAVPSNMFGMFLKLNAETHLTLLSPSQTP